LLRNKGPIHAPSGSAARKPKIAAAKFPARYLLSNVRA
jgi:hypothetical protein